MSKSIDSYIGNVREGALRQSALESGGRTEKKRIFGAPGQETLSSPVIDQRSTELPELRAAHLEARNHC